MRRRSLIGLMLFLLAGCGQKGALFLPDSEESAGINQITAGVMDN